MKIIKEITTTFLTFIIIISLAFFSVSCGKKEEYISPVGSWRAVLNSPGGELAFWLEIKSDGSRELIGGVRNGKEFLPFSRVEYVERKVTMSFDHYDSAVMAEISEDGNSLEGEWSRRGMHGKHSSMDFRATRVMDEKDASHRFMPLEKTVNDNAPKDISGEWEVEFSDNGGKSSAKGIFSQNETYLEGTFLTPTGDYRFLEGSYEGGALRLSVFDGAHAFLFKATADAEGNLKGDFWSRDSYHATWTAVRGSKEMPDPFSLTKLNNEEKRFSFSFPDLEEKTVTEKDSRFDDKVLVVYIFGTWCPNCNDEAPFLEELYKKYNDRGLEVVGLANEFTGEYKKDRDMVARYVKKYDLSWPVLIVGIADKKKTAEALSDLDRVLAYPTTLFIDRNKQVQKIYTGFSGPGTGKYHQTLKEEFVDIIEKLLNNESLDEIDNTEMENTESETENAESENSELKKDKVENEKGNGKSGEEGT